MALSDKNIVITPNIGQTADPKIVFSGADGSTGANNITLTTYPTNSGTLSFDGSAGQLFSITNSLTGTLFSVNDISGIPSIEVIDTGLVRLTQYSGRVLLGTGTDNASDKLQVVGNIGATGSITASGTISATSASIATGATGYIGATGQIGAPSGYFNNLFVNGTSVSGGGASAVWSRKTTTYTAVAGDLLIADTTAGAFTITLPATPATGAAISIADGNNWATNNLTVARNDSTIEGLAEDLVVDIKSIILTLIYDGTTWEPFASVSPIGASGVNGATGTVNLFTAQFGPQTGATGATGSVQILGGLQVGTGATGATGTITSDKIGINTTYFDERLNVGGGAMIGTGSGSMRFLPGSGAYPSGNYIQSGSSTTITSTADLTFSGMKGTPVHMVLNADGGLSLGKYFTVGTLTGATGATGAIAASGTISSSKSIGASGVQGAFAYGTLNYPDGNIMGSWSSSVDSYNQLLLQNTSTGTSASTNFVVSNDQATNSTWYGELGMNSSLFNTGVGGASGASGAFIQPNMVYVAAQSSDLAIGTFGAKPIHFVVNNGARDAMTINSTNAVAVNAPLIVGTGATGATGTITASSSATATAFIPTGAAAPTNGMYLPAANEVGFTTGTNDAIRILSTGNVGIGTTNPGSFKLELVQGTGANNVDMLGVVAKNTGGTFQRLRFIGNDLDSTPVFSINTDGPSIRLNPNGVERMRVNTSGHVGIASTLNVGSLATGATGAFGATGTITASGSISATSGSITTGATGYVGATGQIGAPSGYFNNIFLNGTALSASGGGLTLSDDTTTNSNHYPILEDITSGSATTGKVSSTKLYFNPSTGTLNATIFNSLSDENQKINIEDIPNALDVVQQLKGVSFNWKSNNLPSYGVIAQDLEKVIPEIVSTGNDGSKSVNYNGIIAFLINAVQEQQKQIDELKDKINGNVK